MWICFTSFSLNILPPNYPELNQYCYIHVEKCFFWISLMLRAPPEGGLLRPPPKLCRKGPKPIPGNSEAS